MGGCGCDEDTSGEVIIVEDQPVRPCGEGIQEVPHRVSAVMEPRGMVHSLATWLAGLLQYICGVLGCSATCLPLWQVNQHEEAHETNNKLHHASVVNHEPSLRADDRSNIVDR